MMKVEVFEAVRASLVHALGKKCAKAVVQELRPLTTDSDPDKTALYLALGVVCSRYQMTQITRAVEDSQ